MRSDHILILCDSDGALVRSRLRFRFRLRLGRDRRRRRRGRRRRWRWRLSFRLGFVYFLNKLDVVRREQAATRAVLTDAGPPAFIQLFDVLDDFALYERHLVVLAGLIFIKDNRAKAYVSG